MKPVCNKVSVKVPATSANLGSGFDTAGIALEYFDYLTFTLDDEIFASETDAEKSPLEKSALEKSPNVRVIIHGEGEDTLPKDETHLVVSTFRKACKIFGLPNLRFTLEARNQIPQARGMGSSAEAIVAAVAAAWTFAHEGELNREAIFEIAAAIEGHPDNVAPAVFGGLTMSWKLDAGEGKGSVRVAGEDEAPLSTGFHTVRYRVAKDISVSVFVPNFELSTELARRALPANVPYGDAIFNVSRAAMLPVAFGMFGADAVKSSISRNALLFAATQDALHQQYRASLMQDSWDLVEALREAGFAAAISGAGSCVAVFHAGNSEIADAQIDKIAKPWLARDGWRVLHVPVNSTGVAITRE
ncbi:homoserine kinase [Bifidobacteriaceae bacterium NR002]|nr:homoserine kinase [Bifidobacteriaceae bacterium NR002]MDZ7550017.1 homoserine kinase [Bifidobacteriaceae bacterium NR047]